MPRAGLSPEAVTDAALALIDTDGPAALTLAEVAKRVGVATPSLYKHVRNLAELRDRISVRVLDAMTADLSAAALGRSGPDALRATLFAYRDYARGHPHRYAAVPQQPGGDNPDVVAAATRLLEVIYAALRGFGLADADLVHATRCVRATAHGFAALEAAGAFALPESLDDTYGRLVTLLSDGLSRG